MYRKLTRRTVFGLLLLGVVLLPALTSAARLSVRWTAPTSYINNPHSGPCDGYDLRYSTEPITSANWDSALQALGEPFPSTPGDTQSMIIEGLTPGVTYYLAIKAGRGTSPGTTVWSALSNVTGKPANWILFPNPFVRSTTALSIPDLPAGTWVVITTASGTVVRNFPNVSGLLTWDGRNQSGQLVSAGEYYVYLPNHRQRAKLIIR